MADSEKLGPEGLGEGEDLNASKEVDALEAANVVAQTDAPVSDDVDADSQENAALEAPDSPRESNSPKETKEAKDSPSKDADDASDEPEASEPKARSKGKKAKKKLKKAESKRADSKASGKGKDSEDLADSDSDSHKDSSKADSEKKSSPKNSGNPQKGTKRSIEERKNASSKERKPVKVKGLQSPKWWAPLLVTLMIVGLIIVVTAYIFGGNFPIKGLGNGNLFIGFGFMLTGFLMTMGWK